MDNKRIRNKKHFKKSIGKCKFCGENTYCTLNIHRIIPGKSKGKYRYSNVVVCCSNCHTKVHDNKIIIDKYYLCTNGKWLLRIIENEIDRFV